jgi:hypothetical protein
MVNYTKEKCLRKMITYKQRGGGKLYLAKALPQFENVLTQGRSTGAFCIKKTILRHNFVK